MESAIHMVDVVGQYKKIKPEIDTAIQRVMNSGQYIMGKEVSEFENEIAAYLGVRHAVGCASGTDALQAAMMALGVQTDDEVITTPFTFVATTETIVLLGAKPVYVDIDPRTFNLDPSAVESVITKKTKAIIPVHLYGQSGRHGSASRHLKKIRYSNHRRYVPGNRHGIQREKSRRFGCDRMSKFLPE